MTAAGRLAAGAAARPRGARLWLRRAGAGALWALVQSAFLVPRLPLGPGAIRFLVPPLAGAAVNAAIAAAFVWWFAVRVVRRREWWRAAHFRLRPVPAGAWPWVATTAAAIVVGTQCALIVLARMLAMPREDGGVTAAYLRQPFSGIALLILAAAVAPLLEEFLFRGWMQRGLERRLPAWGAIVVTALVFAAAHLQWFGFPLRFGFAIASGYAAWATRSIWPSVVLHGAYNASLVVLGALTPGVDETVMRRVAHDPRVFWPAAGGALLSVGVAALALRQLRRVAVADRNARRQDA
ncbi:MAG TPA: type II CAAX endopeptidase family protein [Gemmatirosa sp.]